MGHDDLPPAAEWPSLLESAALRVSSAEDREDLFLIKAMRAADY